MPKKSPKPAQKVSQPRAKNGNDIPHPPIEAGHGIQGKAAEAGKDAAMLPAEKEAVFPYPFALVATTALHFFKPDTFNASGALRDAIQYLDFVRDNLPARAEKWCQEQRFRQALERTPELNFDPAEMQESERENVFLRGVGHIMGTKKAKDIQPFRRFLCMLSRTDDSLGDAISALIGRHWDIRLNSGVSDEQRRKICESRTESRAEKKEIDGWIYNYRRSGFGSVELTILKSAFEQLHKLEISYQNSIKGASGGRGKKGGLKREKKRGKKS